MNDFPEVARAVIDVIENDIVTQPRTLQATIGPSEIGIDCLKCLTRKLAGYAEPSRPDWLPYVGTAVHAQLATAFEKVGEWVPEMPLHIGYLGGEQIKGTCDLYHPPSGTVVDFKVVGETTLKAARKQQVSNQYVVQAQCYGRGWDLLTGTVTKVAICYLPRNKPKLDTAVWVEFDYDPEPVYAAFRRAGSILDLINEGGAENTIAMFEGAPGCYSCLRYDPSGYRTGFEDLFQQNIQGDPQ